MRQDEFDKAAVLALARRRAKRDRELLKVIEIALRHPDLKWAKHTTSGLMFCGPEGTVLTHFTNSDHRALKNFISDLRKAGIYPTNRLV
jgi:hypothetical protein